MSPPERIAKILSQQGISARTIKYWIAVSAFETNGWTSKVFRDSKNAFCIIVPGEIRLPYGEGQTIYSSIDASVYGLIDHVLKPFKYKNDFDSIYELVRFMKAKGYFRSDAGQYQIGVETWYNKLF